MDDKPERVADYFLVVGLGSRPTPMRHVVEDEPVTVSTVAEDPVTDVVLVSKKHETCPKGYQCVESTPSSDSTALNGAKWFGSPLYLCYRRGGRQAPVIELSIYSADHGRKFPSGHEAIAVTVGGRSADLSGGSKYPVYLTIKRALRRGHGTAITSLAVAIGKEDCPAGYKPLSAVLGGNLLPVRICYKTRPVGPSSTAYTAELLSRYPLSDHSEFPLSPSVSLFCLPFGVSVELWDRHASFPLPTFSTFALTGATGQCMYGACIVFYEPVLSDCSAIHEMRSTLQASDNAQLHMNKCVCVLSHWPFFSAFKSFLSALYRLSLSKDMPLPLERYVANLMLDVPFPSYERPRVQMLIGAESILFSLPIRTSLPVSVSTHWTLPASLDADSCVTLIHLMLLEQKVMLHSTRPALLTSIGEALRSLLFPLQWQCTYIPLCPLAFSSYLQAPVPFIIGIDSRFLDISEPPSGVSVVDLDASIIKLSTDSKQLLSTAPLPARAAKMLRKALHSLTGEVAGIAVGGDFAVEVAPLDPGTSYKVDQERADITVREVFLRFMMMLLAGYRSCLQPLMAPPTSSHCWDSSELFDCQQFLKQHPAAERSFYLALFDTQTFTSFLEQRSFTHSETTSMALIDEWIEKVMGDSSAKLLDVEEILSRKYDLPTVVTPPADDHGLPRGVQYNYPMFPGLDATLIHSPLRPPTAVAASSVPSLSVAVRLQAEKGKSRKVFERAAGSDLLWGRVLLSQACALWYMLLPAHLHSQWNKVEVLSQAMQLLASLRQRDTHPSDEVAYRVLMDQCMQYGRPVLAVRVYTDMRSAGIQPSAFTYAFYNKAMLETTWPGHKKRWIVLKIVIIACIRFRRAGRTRRHSSGLEEGVDTVLPLQRLRSSGELSSSSVYRLNTQQQAGDYAVKGGAFYIADKVPEWGRVAADQENQTRRWWHSSRYSLRQKSAHHHVWQTSHEQDGVGMDVRLTSCCQCPHCNRLLYDEEIMVCWSDGGADYTITCPYCRGSLVPTLSITTIKRLPKATQETSLDEPEDSSQTDPLHRKNDLQSTKPEGGGGYRHRGMDDHSYIARMRAFGHRRTASAPIPSPGPHGVRPQHNISEYTQETVELSVPYLSPIVLRKEVESLITQGKGQLLEKESLVTDKPIIYWNLVWYFTRLELPTYLPLLSLRRLGKLHPLLQKEGISMHVETTWDRRMADTPDPLYMTWQRQQLRLSRVVESATAPRGHTTHRRTSTDQLQSLVARIQCGDLLYAMRCLLEDRLPHEDGEPAAAAQHSVYRQLLFLRCAVHPRSVDIDQYDKEYQSCLQKLPKELSVTLDAHDHPPVTKAVNCRRLFGVLHVLNNIV